MSTETSPSQPRFSRSAATVLILVAIGATAILAMQPWWQAQLAFNNVLTISGSEGTGSLALLLPGIAAAAWLLSLTLRTIGRRISYALVIAAAAAMLILGLFAPAPSQELIMEKVQRISLVDATVPQVTKTIFGWLYAASAALIVVAGLQLARLASRNIASASRYDHHRQQRLESNHDLWKAIDEGDDPTESAEPKGANAANSGKEIHDVGT